MLSLLEPIDIGTSASGTRISLAPMTLDAADALGAAFSKIDPWVRYPLNPAGHGAILGAHLGAIEPGAPRYEVSAGAAACGAVGLRLNWFSGPYLQFLGILPGFQGQGLGSMVLSWLDAAAREHGARNVWVAASDFNAGAIRLYEKHGFKRVAVIDNLVADGLNEVLLRKKL